MASESSFGPVSGGKSRSRGDRGVAALADRQHGVVTRAQLLGLGLGERAVENRIARGLLHPMHRGVYAVGHRPRTHAATWMAAALAAGPGAVLSHRSAAALWAIRGSGRSVVEVTSPRLLRRPGIQSHRILLPSDEVTVEDGIPVTTPARTLFDLAAVVRPEQLEHAFNEAEYRRLTSPTSLDALLARYPGHRGSRAIRRVLEKHRQYGTTVPREELERRLVTLIDSSGLPRPEINRHTDHGELDATWPEEKLVVECDGFAAHGTRKAFEDDRARDRALEAAGWRVVRITRRQLTTDPDGIAADLRTLLDG